MSNAEQMDLMVKLANAKNALVAVQTALACIGDDGDERSAYLEEIDESYYDAVKFDLRIAEKKLEAEVKLWNKKFKKYVKFIPANKETA